MRVEIYAGDHVPAWYHVIVDGLGMLVDLAPMGGILADPLVTTVIWDDGARDQRGFAGVVIRRDTNAVSTQNIGDYSVVEPYVKAFLARKAELNA